jgi:hypothetical protein
MRRTGFLALGLNHLFTDAAQVARGLAMPDHSPDPAGSETPGRVIFVEVPQPRLSIGTKGRRNSTPHAIARRQTRRARVHCIERGR